MRSGRTRCSLRRRTSPRLFADGVSPLGGVMLSDGIEEGAARVTSSRLADAEKIRMTRRLRQLIQPLSDEITPEKWSFPPPSGINFQTEMQVDYPPRFDPPTKKLNEDCPECRYVEIRAVSAGEGTRESWRMRGQSVRTVHTPGQSGTRVAPNRGSAIGLTKT
jgi:hypothetical protein